MTSNATPFRYIVSAVGTLRGVEATMARRGHRVGHDVPEAELVPIKVLGDPGQEKVQGEVVVRSGY